MKKFLLPVLLLVMSFSLTAQDHQHQKCGHDYVMEIMENNYPGFQENVNHTFQEAKANSSSFNRGGGDPIYTLPVIVHIVYQNEDQNVPDAQINKVITRLNEDFRHVNANQTDVRPIWDDVAGDAGIEFCLHDVVRVQTTATFELDLFGGTLPDNVKQASEGGSDAVDPSSYLNMWVCFIEGGALLGYAYPPAGLSNWPDGSSAPAPGLDGVVIHVEAFDVGTTFSTQGTTVPMEGRTVVHEVGHYLGLRHIWGDGILAQFGIPDCTVDDGVDDTPNQGVPSQFACNPGQNSCTEGNPDLPDMYENYMDYADELCMGLFSNDQVAIMRGVLENQRNGLVNTTCSGIAGAPVSDFTPGEIINICPGTEISFTDASSNSPIAWFWELEGATPSTSTMQNPTVTYEAGGTYNVTLHVSNEFGEDSKTSQAIVVVEDVEFNNNITPSACNDPSTGGAIDLEIAAGNVIGYAWSTGETTQDLNGLAAGEYTVTVSTSSVTLDCDIVYTFTVEDPTVELSASASETMVDLVNSGNVNFTSSADNATSWSWDFGDGNTSTMQNPNHTYTEVGTYTVMVTASNDFCSATETITITVDDTTPVSDIEGLAGFKILPNPFNNEFAVEISLDETKDLSTKIYNTVGKLVAGNEHTNLSGVNVLEFDASEWTTGVYFLHLDDGKGTKVVKLLKL